MEEKEQRTVKQRIAIYITYSKTAEVIVPDDYTKDQLEEAARDQILLPKEVMDGSAARQNFSWAKAPYEGWEEEEFHVSDY